MGELVWVSSAMSEPALIMPVRNEVDDDLANKPIDSGHRNNSGEALRADNFPSKI